MNSFNHYAYGFIGTWLYNTVETLHEPMKGVQPITKSARASIMSR